MKHQTPKPEKQANETTMPAVENSTFLKVGDILLDHYRIEEILGQGGSSIVYKVRHNWHGTLFAVKIPFLDTELDVQSRRLLFREIRTWIDLPTHPHLTACRFVRLHNEQILIFSEYVDGGSLLDQIRHEQLLRIQDILDVAIQSAWGLYSAHIRNVVHKDIKPANILITSDGIAKITDFGLARVHELPPPPMPGSTQKTISQSTISSGRMTPAFCSPEQSRGEELDFRTDIWSFGLTVLCLFYGPPNWISGIFGEAILRKYLDEGSRKPYPAMPDSVAAILKKCLRQKKSERWASMAEIAHALREAFQLETSRDYFRETPSLDQQKSLDSYDRMLPGGDTWDDPVIWLERAARESGRTPEEMSMYSIPMEGSREARAYIDIEMYHEARSIYEDLIASGRWDLETCLVELLKNESFVHKRLRNITGALEITDQMISRLERMIEHDSSDSLQVKLAVAFNMKGRMLREIDRFPDAILAFDKGIEIFESLTRDGQHSEHLENLAGDYMNRANMIMLLGDFTRPIQDYEKVMNILESIPDSPGSNRRQLNLAYTYMNKAAAHININELDPPVTLLDHATAIFEKLIHDAGMTSLVIPLTHCYSNRSLLARIRNDFAAALEMSDRAIQRLEHYVYQDGHREKLDILGMYYLNKANVYLKIRDYIAAMACQDQARCILEPLVLEQNRLDLHHALAKLYLSRGRALNGSGNALDAKTEFSRVEESARHLVEDAGNIGLLTFWAVALTEIVLTSVDIEDYQNVYHSTDRVLNILTESRQDNRLDQFVFAEGNLLAVKAVAADALGKREEAVHLARTCLSMPDMSDTSHEYESIDILLDRVRALANP